MAMLVGGHRRGRGREHFGAGELCFLDADSPTSNGISCFTIRQHSKLTGALRSVNLDFMQLRTNPADTFDMRTYHHS
jgi:hypothetical protein